MCYTNIYVSIFNIFMYMPIFVFNQDKDNLHSGDNDIFRLYIIDSMPCDTACRKITLIKFDL